MDRSSREKSGDEQSNLDRLREEVAIGLQEADRGEFVEFTAETIIAEGRKILESRRAESKQIRIL